MRIRLATPDERAALEALQRRASLALPDYREQLQANPDAIHLPLEQIERGEVFVAERDERTVGFAVLIFEEGKAELDGLFVDPKHWRTGVGTTLIDAAVHEARRRGMTLAVVASPGARAFYEKCGFAVEGGAETRFGPALRMSR